MAYTPDPRVSFGRETERREGGLAFAITRRPPAAATQSALCCALLPPPTTHHNLMSTLHPSSPSVASLYANRRHPAAALRSPSLAWPRLVCALARPCIARRRRVTPLPPCPFRAHSLPHFLYRSALPRCCRAFCCRRMRSQCSRITRAHVANPLSFPRCSPVVRGWMPLKT